MPPMIIDQAMQRARELCAGPLAGVRIERLVVGIYFTFLQLSNGSCGLAMTETESELAGAAGRGRCLGPFSPGQLGRQPLSAILDHPDDRPVYNSIRWAVLNACSGSCGIAQRYRVRSDRDVLDYVDASAGRRITLVGAFNSIMDRLSVQACTLGVLELKPEMVAPQHRHLHVPAGESAAVLAVSDSVIITGSTLVNRTLDDLLLSVRPKAQVALIGPSAGLFPDLLFERGVSLIGTIRVSDADSAFATICEGGSGYHLYRRCAEKVIIENGPAGR